MSTETAIARKLINAGLAAGYTVSVYDGGEWTVKRSRKLSDIVGALQTTDSDVVRFRNEATGEVVGSVWLIWGNGEDVISDHTDNEATTALVDSVIG